jgi:hypothetical protein
MAQALELITRALALLDEANAPGEIGCHVDLARDRLAGVLDAARQTESIIWAAFPKPAA